jgi:hypothetical protein
MSFYNLFDQISNLFEQDGGLNVNEQHGGVFVDNLKSFLKKDTTVNTYISQLKSDTKFKEICDKYLSRYEIQDDKIISDHKLIKTENNINFNGISLSVATFNILSENIYKINIYISDYDLSTLILKFSTNTTFNTICTHIVTTNKTKDNKSKIVGGSDFVKGEHDTLTNNAKKTILGYIFENIINTYLIPSCDYKLNESNTIIKFNLTLKKIQECDADIICLQECTKKFYDYIMSKVPNVDTSSMSRQLPPNLAAILPSSSKISSIKSIGQFLSEYHIYYQNKLPENQDSAFMAKTEDSFVTDQLEEYNKLINQSTGMITMIRKLTFSSAYRFTAYPNILFTQSFTDIDFDKNSKFRCRRVWKCKSLQVVISNGTNNLIIDNVHFNISKNGKNYNFDDYISLMKEKHVKSTTVKPDTAECSLLTPIYETLTTEYSNVNIGLPSEHLIAGDFNFDMNYLSSIRGGEEREREKEILISNTQIHNHNDYITFSNMLIQPEPCPEEGIAVSGEIIDESQSANKLKQDYLKLKKRYIELKKLNNK